MAAAAAWPAATLMGYLDHLNQKKVKEKKKKKKKKR
jgi:hypothetical protein